MQRVGVLRRQLRGGHGVRGHSIMETSASLVGPIVSWAVLIALTIWVFVDAKAIGDDHGRSPGLVYTKPAAWAAGVFLALIVVLPIYLVNRVRYKRLAAKHRAAKLLLLPPEMDSAAYAPDVWPPPPKKPAV